MKLNLQHVWHCGITTESLTTEGSQLHLTQQQLGPRLTGDVPQSARLLRQIAAIPWAEPGIRPAEVVVEAIEGFSSKASTVAVSPWILLSYERKALVEIERIQSSS